MHKSDEMLKAIAARISMSVRLLDEGDSVGAKAVLQRILTVLPVPDERNVAAALADAGREAWQSNG
ncbi:MAG: hypothetical protein ACXWT1_04745 [Methylobacter sp.]